MSNIQSYVKKYKAIKKHQHDLKNNHSKLIGLKVKMSPKYRKWLKGHLDELTDNKGDELYEDIINKKVNEATVIDTSCVDHEINLHIQFSDGRTKHIGLEDVIEIK